MLQALARTGSTPIARVPWNDPAWIGKLLDAGAEVVIVPMINNADDAGRAAAASHFPPLGSRSYGPTRTSMFLGVDTEEVNREVMCLAMIETREGVEEADSICATPGIDGIYVGPSDLAISLGHKPRQRPVPKDLEAAIATVLAACRRNGILPGIHAGSGPAARSYAEQGFRIVTVGTDLGWLREGITASLAQGRNGLA
jgi:4-hydroxy-2-oxoheptanedioate aldolase